MIFRRLSSKLTLQKQITPNSNSNSPISHLPTELWIQITNHLQSHALTQLSLVSRRFRSIAQQTLFYQINHDGKMSEKTYRKLCRCGKRKYRHVLTYVRDFTIPDPNINSTFNWVPPLHPAALIPCMINLRRLNITIRNEDKHLIYVLQHCPETYHLEELSFVYDGSLTKNEEEVVKDFISKQNQLKCLRILISACLQFSPEVLDHLESINADWKQIVVLLPGRALVGEVAIRDCESSSSVLMEGIQLEKELVNIRSLYLHLGVLKSLRIWKHSKNLEILWVMIHGNPFNVSNVPNNLLHTIMTRDPLARSVSYRSFVYEAESDYTAICRAR